MAVITVQDVTAAGITPSYVAASAGGDSFTNNGRTMLHIKNGGTSSITVTIVSARTCNFGFQHDLTVTINASSEKMIGPFAPERFNNDSAMMQVNYSAVTSVTVAALEV